MEHVSRWLAFVLILTFCTIGFAEEIKLKNGDRLTGNIIEESGDEIVIETEYAGKLKIARKHIEKINKPADLPKTSDVEAARSIPAAVPKVATAEKTRSANGVVRRLMAAASGWDGNANIGFSYTSGNSNNVTMTTGLRATKSRPNDGFTIYVRSLWNSNHAVSATTQNAFWGGFRYDRTIDKRFFGFVSYDFERDKPKKLKFRSVAGGGLGHRTIKNDRTELEFLGGIAWNRTWQTNVNTNTPEALAGVTFKHKLNDKLRLQNATTFFQNITDITEYRAVFDTTLSIDVTKKIGFYITLGDRFNSDPFGTAKKNDFLFTTGMRWNFGKKK